MQKTHWTCCSMTVILRSKAADWWPPLAELRRNPLPLRFNMSFAVANPGSSSFSCGSASAPSQVYCFPGNSPARPRAMASGLSGGPRRSGTDCGAFHALCGNCSSAWARRITASREILFANGRKRFLGPSVNPELCHLEARPARDSVPEQRREIGIGEYQLCTRTKSP